MTSSNICPTCGNTLQPYMHGICTVCQRNQQEHKRYGHHRPYPNSTAKISPHRHHKPNTTLRICPLCDREIAAYRYDSHMWNAHGVNPYTPKAELQRLRAEKTAKKSSATQKRTPTSTPCPICHASIALTYQQQHHAYHQDAEERFSENDLRLGINHLLTDLYPSPHLLSHILNKNGFTPAQIRILHKTKRSLFFHRLKISCQTWLTATLSSLEASLLIRLYSLSGLPAANHADLAHEYALSLDSLNQLSQQALNILRQPTNIHKLEKKICLAAATFFSPG